MGYGGYDRRGLWLFALRRAASGDACAVYRLCRAELQALQGGGREEAGAAAGALCRSPARGRGVQTDRFADRREFQLGLSAAVPVLDQHFPYRAARMEAEQAARQFPLFYLYPRGDGGTAVPDVDVASGGELHVLAFDERAYPARGLSHHVVFRRRHPAERQVHGQVLLAAAGHGGADLLRQPAARYEFHVSDVRAGRQSARVVP